VRVCVCLCDCVFFLSLSRSPSLTWNPFTVTSLNFIHDIDTVDPGGGGAC
jgi:hypothetical protein